MLEQSDSLLLDELINHVAQHGADGVEALISLADVLQAQIVEQNLLDDENGDGLAEFAARLHDAQAEWDDFCCQQEVDDFTAVVLDQRTNDTEGSQAEVLKRARFGGGVQERIEEQRDMSYKAQE